MERTEAVRILAVFVAVGLVGCAGVTDSPPAEPTLSVENGTLAPGETTTLTIQATNVGELTYSLENDTALTVTEFSADLPATSGADSYPPHWFWSSPPESMTATITLTASETARPGSYTGTLTVWNVPDSADSSTSRTQTQERFVIEIADS
jgi:hypothetical protein